MQIGNETIDIEEVTDIADYGAGMFLVTIGRKEYYIAKSHEVAGDAARAYWESLARDDPLEITALLGEKNLVAWALGLPASPGSTQVTSLEEWLDLWLDTPEEHWASYDGEERDFNISPGEAEKIEIEFGIELPQEGVAYRHN